MSPKPEDLGSRMAGPDYRAAGPDFRMAGAAQRGVPERPTTSPMVQSSRDDGRAADGMYRRSPLWPYVEHKFKRGLRAAGRVVRHFSSASFVATFVASRIDRGSSPQDAYKESVGVAGFYDDRLDQIVVNAQLEDHATLVHELTHLLARSVGTPDNDLAETMRLSRALEENPRATRSQIVLYLGEFMDRMGSLIAEGATAYFASIALRSSGLPVDRAYPDRQRVIRDLAAFLAPATTVAPSLAQAYFDGDVFGLELEMDRRAGAGAFQEWKAEANLQLDRDNRRAGFAVRDLGSPLAKLLFREQREKRRQLMGGTLR